MASTDREAAQLTLHVLRAVLPGGAEAGGVRRIVIRDRTDVVDEEQAILILAALRKPLVCIAQVTNRTMVIEVNHPRRRFRDPVTNALITPDLVSEYMLEATGGSPTARILVRGRDDARLITTFAAIEQFSRDYLIRGHYYVIGDYPSRDDAGSGIAWVLKFIPSHSVTSVTKSL